SRHNKDMSLPLIHSANAAAGRLTALLAMMLLLSAPAAGQSQFVNPSGAPPEWINPASTTPAELDGIVYEQRLGAQVDLDLAFTDSNGSSVRLGDYFGDKPVVLALVYYDCPMLCTLELN